MSLPKLLQLRPLVLKNTTVIGTRLFSWAPKRARNNRVLSDDNNVFNMASGLMRDLEREFERTRRQLESSFLNTDRGLLNLPAENEDDTKLEPIVTDKQGNRQFQLALDLKGFTPEEIKVKTEGRNLIVSAKKETEVKKTKKS